MRYVSISFVEPAGKTMASLADSYFTKDANGYATLIVGTGAAIPSWITPEHGYTFLDLTAFPDYQDLVLLTMRHIIPSPGFNCTGQLMPYHTSIDTPAGSLVGDYAPVVDYPLAATLPTDAAPLVGVSSCDSFPAGLAGTYPSCGVFPEPPISITSMVTQCQAPGCTTFAAQPNPPVIVSGTGFGVFPNGLPFAGTSKYLRVLDLTQKWSAGLSNDTCTVSISSWADNLIQLVPHVNSNGACPLAVGDSVRVVVWNPQSMSEAKLDVKVTAN